MMTKEEWGLWDRIFSSHFWEMSRQGPSALNSLKSSLATVVGGGGVEFMPPQPPVQPTIEECLMESGRIADLAIRVRRKRKKLA